VDFFLEVVMKTAIATWIVSTFGVGLGMVLVGFLIVLAIALEIAWWILLVYIAARIWKSVN
jgi:hypothetical protein